MTFFLKLPVVLVVEVLGEWLPTITLIHLDSAVTNRSSRLLLSSVWLEMVPITNEKCCGLINSSFYKWAYTRGVRLRNLYLSPECFWISLQLKFDCNYSTVEEIVLLGLNECHGPIISGIIEKSHNVRLLELSCDVLLSVPLSILLKVPGIRVSLDTCVQPAFKKLSECPLLESLCITTKLNEHYFVDLQNLLMSCSMLTNVELRCSYEIVDTVSKHCPRLRMLTLDANATDECSLIRLTNLLEERPLINRLVITTSGFSVQYDAQTKFFGIMEYCDATEDVCALISMLNGLRCIEFNLGSVDCNMLVPSLDRFCSTMDTLFLANSIVEYSMVKRITRHYSLLEKIDLWVLCEENELLEAFSVINTLKYVHLVFENATTMTTLCKLFESLPCLVDFAFEVVWRNEEGVEELRDLVMHRYLFNRALKGHIGFVCDRVLRFSKGRFGGKGVWEYLTHEEREYWRNYDT